MFARPSSCFGTRSALPSTRDWNRSRTIRSSCAVLPVPGGPVMYKELPRSEEMVVLRKCIIAAYSFCLVGRCDLSRLTVEERCSRAFVRE